MTRGTAQLPIATRLLVHSFINFSLSETIVAHLLFEING